MLFSPSSRSLEVKLVLAVVICFSIGALLVTRKGSAATPANGTLSQASPNLTYTSGPFLVSNPTDQVDGVPTCNGTLPCDDYTLTVDVPAGFDNSNYVKIQVSWPHQATLAQYDLFVYKLNADNSLGSLVAANFFAVDPDVVTISAISGKYLLRIAPTIAQGDMTTTRITLEQKVAAAPVGSGLAPRYQSYKGPGTVGNSAGEPSLGVGLAGPQFPQGHTIYQANTTTLRVEWDDCPSPAASTWTTKTPPNTSTTTLDPILFTDRVTGRTFVSQLAGGCSRAAYTDTAAPFSDGDTWVPSQGCGTPAGVDHQTFGGGPLAPPLTGNPAFPLYPNSLYYCSQYGTNAASCAISLDGGITFGPAVPIYQISCFGIHGHIKVAPDGTAYVPNSDCSTSLNGPSANDTAHQGLVFSEDNGATWSAPQLVPDSNPAPGIVDPSIGIGANGTIYYGYANSNGAPSVAVGHKVNHQIVWSPSKDVGSALGIKNSTFPEVVAGDDNRAAFAFLGTTTGGYYQDPTDFQGIWHLYVATTYDGGATWITIDATPNDPVQLGSICNSGTVICGRTPNDRNLLDFMDISVDRLGRVQVAYPDGCTSGPCIQAVDRNGPSGTPDGKVNRFDNDNGSKASIARQSGGRALFAAFDPVEPAAPKAPNVISATRDANGVHLTFLQPDNGGLPITSYRIQRGTSSGNEILLASIPATAIYDINQLANKTSFDDTSVVSTITYFYRVTAVNSAGEGSYCREFQLAGAAPTSTIQFSATGNSSTEGCSAATVNITRSGATSEAATVDYATTDGSAKQKSDYAVAAGKLVFNPGETSKSLKILLTDDGYAEGTETLTVNLSNPTGGAALGSETSITFNILDNDTATSTTTNVIDDAGTFVCQHYHDFLNRQGDSGGQAYWTDKLTQCGTDAACIQRQRIGVSAAFFIEQEFQQTGFYVYRAYKALLGRRLAYTEFMSDRSRLLASSNLDAAKTSYTLELVQRSEAVNKYANAPDAPAFVDALIKTVRDNSGVELASKRDELLAEYNTGTSQNDSRARTLRKVVEYDEFKNVEYNRAFVLAQYFGYLRREPDASGYDFWLNVLTQNPSNYRGMVCAFITAFEYQDRFGSAHTHNNQECNGSP
ncbi:MAG TPA: Calx-beta domain-containing protein [Pyrinomonadaceae bacterium]|nr:Calx-beta domain-containing protein [Pyrinomonadaceae bacterium]